MSRRGQVLIECECCGTFSATAFCSQCRFAGCESKKKGESCYLRQHAGVPVIPQVTTRGSRASQEVSR